MTDVLKRVGQGSVPGRTRSKVRVRGSERGRSDESVYLKRQKKRTGLVVHG